MKLPPDLHHESGGQHQIMISVCICISGMHQVAGQVVEEIYKLHLVQLHPGTGPPPVIGEEIPGPELEGLHGKKDPQLRSEI